MPGGLKADVNAHKLQVLLGKAPVGVHFEGRGTARTGHGAWFCFTRRSSVRPLCGHHAGIDTLEKAIEPRESSVNRQALPLVVIEG